jgi:hypothetical protein
VTNGAPLKQNLLLFHADEQTISLCVWNPYGEKIEEVPDLMMIRE